MTRVLLYARLSVTTEESVSIERQLDAGRKYAAARGWTVAGEFVDDGVSASKIKPEARPGWRALLATEDPFDAVVVWKVDRLARRVLDFLNADNALQERGAGLVCVEDPIDMTTPQGRAFATVLAVFAELEAASISARVKDARRALLKAGRRGGGRPPYGWKNVPNPDGPGVVLAKDPDRIGYVEGLVERALRGDSIYSLVLWMDEVGAPLREHKNRKRNTWSEASVESILWNPVICGLTAYQAGRKAGEDADPWKVVRDDDGVMVVDESVQVLTIEERRRLLDVLQARRRPGSRPQQGRNPNLLSRLVVCGTCGRNLHHSKVAGLDAYRCAHRECERRPTVLRARIENHVIERVLAERGETRLHEYRDHTGPDDHELALIEQALRDAGSELATTDDEEREAHLVQQIARLKERRVDARRAKPQMKKIVTPARGTKTWGEEFRTALDAGDVREQQRLLREQVQRITIRAVGQTGSHTAIEDRALIEFVPVEDEIDAA